MIFEILCSHSSLEPQVAMGVLTMWLSNADWSLRMIGLSC